MSDPQLVGAPSRPYARRPGPQQLCPRCGRVVQLVQDALAWEAETGQVLTWTYPRNHCGCGAYLVYEAKDTAT